ncbi:MAG TPA: DUF4118 domain-containing protein, partial [Isosphaeraceae bacterium]
MVGTSQFWQRYAGAVACIGAATLARWWLDPVLGSGTPYITFFVAVAAASWYGGLGPGLLALGLGAAAAAYLFLAPRGSILVAGSANLLGLTLYLGTGLIIVLAAEAQRAARRRAEASAQEARRALAAERAQREQLDTTLRSIGDAVIVTDANGRVTLLNPVARRLTGWGADEARGRPLAEVFPIVDELTRAPAASPVDRALREGAVVGLANHTLLIARDGREWP